MLSIEVCWNVAVTASARKWAMAIQIIETKAPMAKHKAAALKPSLLCARSAVAAAPFNRNNELIALNPASIAA